MSVRVGTVFMGYVSSTIAMRSKLQETRVVTGGLDSARASVSERVNEV